MQNHSDKNTIVNGTLRYQGVIDFKKVSTTVRVYMSN